MMSFGPARARGRARRRGRSAPRLGRAWRDFAGPARVDVGGDLERLADVHLVGQSQRDARATSAGSGRRYGHGEEPARRAHGRGSPRRAGRPRSRRRRSRARRASGSPAERARTRAASALSTLVPALGAWPRGRMAQRGGGIASFPPCSSSTRRGRPANVTSRTHVLGPLLRVERLDRRFASPSASSDTESHTSTSKTVQHGARRRCARAERAKAR